MIDLKLDFKKHGRCYTNARLGTMEGDGFQMKTTKLTLKKGRSINKQKAQESPKRKEGEKPRVRSKRVKKKLFVLDTWRDMEIREVRWQHVEPFSSILLV